MIHPFIVASLCAAVLVLLTFDAPAQGRKRVPRFEDYAVKEIYDGKSAKLALDTDEQRDSLIYYQAIADGGTSFAGHYAVATLTCGTGCVAHDFLDLRTGRIISGSLSNSGGTQTHDRFREIEFRRGSRMIVFAGRINDKGPLGWHFYEFNNGKLKRLHTVATKDFRKPLSEWMK